MKNDDSLFPKIDFCVKGFGMSHGLDEDGQEIFSSPYIFTRGKKAFIGPHYKRPHMTFSGF